MMLALVMALCAQDMKVIETPDLAYYDGPDADPKKHKLDLYLPESKDKVPVVMWIHGGGWTLGDRKLFLELGRRFAERGIGCAAISYRLSPAVKHPEHIKDCARAFAWLVTHVKDYGGDPDRLFVCGQSAGGHLAALLALNRGYLDELKVPAGAIKGVIPMSGIYQVLPFKRENALTGMIRAAFGDEPKTCQDASPTHFAKNAKAPMLVITEGDDLGDGEAGIASAFIRESATIFRKALDLAGFKDATFMDAKDRNHLSIVMSMMKKGDDAVRDAIVDFVKKRATAR